MDVASKVRELVAEDVCLPVNELSDLTSLADYSYDSFDIIELSLDLEDVFDIKIEDLDKNLCIPDIIKLCEQKLKEKEND